MNDFDRALGGQLAALQEQGLYRQLRRVDSPQGSRIHIEAKDFLNFSSNDYLGLVDHPVLKEAATRAVQSFGAGSGSSRLICGSLGPHHALDDTLAEFKGTERALSFSSGYGTAIGTICALLGPDDVLIIDRLVHACIVDAARLCRAKLRVFAHNDLNDLERLLRWAEARTHTARAAATRAPRILVVTESVFSMDGDHAPLREIVALKNRYGAWLMLDEAHATGLYGTQHRGLAEADGVAGQIEVQMGTLGKALGSAGGYICGSGPLIDLLVNRARTFIFSTAPVPAAAAAATAAIELVKSEEGRRRSELLWQRVAQFRTLASPLLPKPLAARPSAIIPIIIGDERRALDAAAWLRDRQFFIPAIRFPTVARGRARLRVTLTANHTAPEVAQAASALSDCLREIPNS